MNEFNNNNNINNFSDKKSKAFKIIRIIVIFFSIILVINIMFGVFRGINSVKTSSSKKENLYDQKTTAVIKNISFDQNSDSHVVNIEYTVDGIKYFGKLNYYDSEMYEGKEIEISYKSENPAEYYSNPFSTSFKMINTSLIFDFLFTILISVGILVITIYTLKKQSKKSLENKNKKLKIKGIRLIGTIKDIEIISNPKGGEPMRRIVCTYTNLQGNTVTVKSDPVYDSIELFFEERGVRTVDVYVDQNNNNYYIDVESIKR